MKKMQHCFYCGEELGEYDNLGERYETCGKQECNREARNAENEERAEAHEQLDRERGWDRGWL
jgi:hypothetical protein